MLTKAGVEFDDGLHELALIRMPENPKDLVTILRDMFVTRDLLHNENLVVRHGKNFKFYFEDKINWTLDGEKGGDHDYVEVKTLENAVTILVEKIKD